MNKIRTGSDVTSIDPKLKIVTLRSGETFKYQNILSTIPLDILTKKVVGLDEIIVSTAQKLKHSSSHIVGIGVEGVPHELLRTKSWMYFPEEVPIIYRMTMFSNYSKFNVPDPEKQYSLMCEVAESEDRKVDRENIIQNIVDGLHTTGLLPKDAKIVSKWKYVAEYGYPTPSLERDNILNSVIPTLDKLALYSRGRFGGWKYEVSNQDHSFMQGVEWVNFILDKTQEVTFKVP